MIIDWDVIEVLVIMCLVIEYPYLPISIVISHWVIKSLFDGYDEKIKFKTPIFTHIAPSKSPLVGETLKRVNW